MNEHKRLYARLMSISDITDIESDEAMAMVGQLADVSLDLKETAGLERAIALVDQIRARDLTPEQSITLYYFAGTAWSNLRALRRATKEAAWEWEQDELENEILNLRQAARREQIDAVVEERRCQILTNLGNAFDHVGRFVEAIELYDRAVAVRSDFPMARGNRGAALILYARSHYDRGHQRVFMSWAHRELKAALDGDLEPGARRYFERLGQELESILPTAELEKDWEMDSHSLGRGEGEKRYRRWCLENRLFLNPLNDLGPHSIAAHDVLSTPSIVVKLSEGPYYQGFYNQMKQEFVSARWLFYESINSKRPHFSDRGVLLFNTLDYPAYSLSVEKAKAGFRIAFSILDKIAFFINKYFALSIKDNDIAFRRIWYVSQERKKGLKPLFKMNKNLPLRGLFWLSKDLYEDRPGFRDALESDARELASIRNHGEHMYLKLHLDMWAGPDSARDSISLGLTDTLARSLYRADFDQKTLRLLKLVRAAMIYLSLAVHREEGHRAERRGPNKIVPPMGLVTIDDRWKI